jgi:hypothetical protein
MTSSSTSETMGADVRELIDDALTIPVIFQREEAGRTAEEARIEGVETSGEMVG